MNMSVENGDTNGDYYYMNSSTVSVIKNNSLINYTKKSDVISTYIYLREKMFIIWCRH